MMTLVNPFNELFERPSFQLYPFTPSFSIPDLSRRAPSSFGLEMGKRVRMIGCGKHGVETVSGPLPSGLISRPVARFGPPTWKVVWVGEGMS